MPNVSIMDDIKPSTAANNIPVFFKRDFVKRVGEIGINIT